MKYCLIIDGVVRQTQPDFSNGFIVCDDSVTCGMLFDGTDYSLPVPPVVVPPTNDEIYQKTLKNNKVIKSVIKSINDGTLVTGAGKTNTQLKTIVKANMNGN